MSDIPKTFDWVSARAKCNAREMFNRLRKVVKTDCEIATDQRSHWKLVFDPVCEKEFSVIHHHDSGIGTVAGVTFRLERSVVRVLQHQAPNKELFSFGVYLLDGGGCTFVMEGKNAPLYPWQVSRLALKDVFFRD